MSQLSLHAEESLSVTSVSNIFIDYYMPAANGSFVKVYLCLLRCMQNLPDAFSVSYLADRLEETEKDIIRALKYWEKSGLLKLLTDENGTITSISLLVPRKPELSDAPVAATQKSVPPVKAVPPKHPSYTAEQIAVLSNDDEVKWIITIIENYLSRPLRPKDLELILYLYDSLHFSAELIFYLYEHCISKGKKSSSYIETVALSWAEQGISTPEEAEEASLQYTTGYTAVAKAFGLNRMPGAAERRYINTWSAGFGFSEEIITEACSRTLLSTQKPDFKYADHILTNWHKKGVSSLKDIKKLDEEFNASRAARLSAPEPQSKAPNRFNAFPQRSYSKEDYSYMEKQLLQRQLKV